MAVRTDMDLIKICDNFDDSEVKSSWEWSDKTIGDKRVGEFLNGEGG